MINAAGVALQAAPRVATNRTTAAAAYRRFRESSYFGSLDGLRCISIVGVIWEHAAAGAVAALPGLALLRHGFMGVHLFFAISGFLITTLLLRERSGTGLISLRKFYLRRSLRIFPLYFAVLAIYVVLVWAMERHTGAGRLFFHNLPYYLTYTSNWFVDLVINEDGQRRVIFIFAWSLATEEQFYLVWPWVLRWIKGPGAVALVAGTLLCSQAVVLATGWGWMALNPQAYRVIASISAPICMGVITAWILHSRAGFARAWTVLGRPWSAPLMLALLVLLLDLRVNMFSDTWRLGVSTTMTLLVGACVIREDHGLRWVLASKPFRYVGMVSYGMYMLHNLGLHVSKAMLGRMQLDGPGLRFVVGLAVTIAAAGLSYRYFEGYFLRLKDRLGKAPAAGTDSRGQRQAPTRPEKIAQQTPLIGSERGIT